METQENKYEMFYPHVSVDCVLLGTNEDKLCVLLVERQVAGSNEKHYKLPGSLIYESEDLDTAAYRVLNEATGLKRVALKQFRSFGSPARTKNKEDVQWLENASKMKITRIVTVAYLALCKFGKKMTMGEMSDTLIWHLSMNCHICHLTIRRLLKLPARRYVGGWMSNRVSFSIIFRQSLRLSVAAHF